MVVESVLDAYRRDVAREILQKVFKAVEEARLDCEFQDEKGNWLMDEGQFLGDFTSGKLFEIAGEYGIDLLKNNSLKEAEKMKFGEKQIDDICDGIKRRTAIECLKILNGIVQDGEAESEFTLGFDTGIEKGMWEICLHFGLDLREVLDD